MRKSIDFIKRERVYVLLFIFAALFHLSLFFADRIFTDDGAKAPLAGGEELVSGEEILRIGESDPLLALVLAAFIAAFVFFAAAGLILDISYLYMRIRGRPLIARTRPIERGRWGLWDVCKVGIIFYAAQPVIWLAAPFFLSAVPYLAKRQNLGLMLSATLADIAALAAVFYFALKKRRHSPSSLGLTPERPLSNIGYGALAYIGLVPVLAGAMFFTAALFEKFNIPIEPQHILVMLMKENHIPTLIYMCLFTGVLGPVIEEIFFRGFVYGALRKKAGIFGGIMISAVFFACVHTNPASFLPILCLGILLAYLYEKTGSLIPSLTVHILHNSASLALLVFIKQISG